MENVPFKRVRTVTLPVHQLKPDGKLHYLRLDSKMRLGKEVAAKAGEKKMEPATLIDVTDLQTGELAVIIAPKVLRGILDESYPGDSYVGKGFELSLHKKEGKRYHQVMLAEVEVPENLPTPGARVEEPPAAEARGKKKRK